MKQEDMYTFLVKTAIPENEWDEGDKNNRIRDAIWRAHRDTLTGRFQLKKYRELTCGEKKHEITDELYQKIEACVKDGCAISSKLLIDYLHNRFKDKEVEFGAIQKLVNMSLKYLIILNAFGFINPIKIEESECHCPLDSIILEKLGYAKLRWTKIGEREYCEVQDKISKSLSSEEKSKGNILYDFKHW